MEDCKHEDNKPEGACAECGTPWVDLFWDLEAENERLTALLEAETKSNHRLSAIELELARENVRLEQLVLDLGGEYQQEGE